MLGSRCCGIFKLPPELWSKIGKHAIDALPFVNGASNPELKTSCRQPPILRVCRALRSELLSHFYTGRISFQLCYFMTDIQIVRFRFLQAIGASDRRCLTGIEIVQHPERLQRVLSILREKWGIEAEAVEMSVPVGERETKGVGRGPSATKYGLRFL